MICIFDLIAYKKYVSQVLYLYICVVFIACIACDTGKATRHYRMFWGRSENHRNYGKSGDNYGEPEL